MGLPVVGGWTQLLPYAQYQPNPPVRSDPMAPQVYFFFGFFFPMMIVLIVLSDHIPWLK
jgi:hypothetical protein